MKTKLFYLFVFILIGGKNQAQSRANTLIERITHFDQFVQHLQKRQSNTATIRLDSIRGQGYDATNNVYTFSSLQTFTFDSNNINIEDAANSWDANNNVFNQQSKSVYTYNNSGMMSSATYYYFDFNTNALIPSQKIIYTYNGSNQLVEMTVQLYDAANSQFVNQQKEVYTYAQTSDPKPNLVQIYQWDTANSLWTDYQKSIITYNANFLSTDIVLQNKDIPNNTWVNNQHFMRTYDTNMRITEALIQSWQSNAWINSTKRAMSYAAMGSYEEIVTDYFTWDDTNSAWTLNGKQKTDIDNNENILQKEGYYLDTSSNQLVGSTKIVYSYTGNNIEVSFYSWDNQTQDWATDNSQKNIYTYDMSVPNTDLILPFIYTSAAISLTSNVYSYGSVNLNFNDFKYKLLTKEYFYRATAADPWVSTYKQTYLYTDTTTGIDEQPQINAKVYPNSFNHTINIEVEADSYSISIYSLDGRQLYQKIHQANDQINLSFLTKGVYIYKLKTDKGFASGQIIKN